MTSRSQKTPFRVCRICAATFGSKKAFVANYYDSGVLKKIYCGTLAEVAIGEKFFHSNCGAEIKRLKKLVSEKDKRHVPFYGWVPTWVVDRRVRRTEDGELLKEETFEEAVDNVGGVLTEPYIGDD